MAITHHETLTDESIREFKIDIPQSELDDLRTRLRLTRWPEKEPVDDWSQGVPLENAKRLIEYWMNDYDWRPVEKLLNSYPQFVTTIDGLGIHFLHIKSPHADALPMIMTHGWPGSVLEFMKVIGPLVDPTSHGGKASDAFHLVIPSLPGHGFSEKPTSDGWGAEQTAKAWGVLMSRLGYDRWVASGGDWGSTVVHWLALQRPEGLLAGHSNWPLVFPKEAPAQPTPEEKAAFDDVGRFVSNVAGYHHEQATRPQTLGYALADSPVGQAIWIFEKFNEWSDNPGVLSHSWGGEEWQPNDGSVFDVFPIDEILDGITLYWLTNSGASSGRYYWENARGTVGTDLAFGRLELPMSGTVFPKDMYRAPRSWAEESWPNLVHWGIAERGGHFAAWEQPDIIVSELTKSFGPQFR
ncbi:epoxide hydrolase family protein [Arthrobacter ramosus]|uniref:Epoxide hydrolase family protein n=1 Tax=Arthrobacter ramosus TaxID=1672 RepID=A0ABV5Y4K6_ARTRM|nr:epoxide hydrolase family protein [Arthrobacter ramosus]